MATNQFQLHRCVHKANRKQSAELLVALGRADFTDGNVRSTLVSDANKLLRTLDRHSLQEEVFVHPHVALASASIANQLDVEHCEHAAAVSQAKQCLHALEHAPRKCIAEYAHALYLAFARVLALDLLHMDYEEREAQPCLLDAFDDVEIQEMDTRTLSQVSHEELKETLQAMLPASNSEECARIIGWVIFSFPPEVSSMLVGGAAQSKQAPVRMPDCACRSRALRLRLHGKGWRGQSPWPNHRRCASRCGLHRMH